jgi:oxygen-independent coproporphyrinogen-3 oxidase
MERFSWLHKCAGAKAILGARFAEPAAFGCRHETMLSMPGFDGDALGLYISIPFCRSKCTYCNFASGVYPASEHARYVERLIEELVGAGDWAARMGVELPRRVDTVYLGGGTPSLLAPELVTRLFAALRAEFHLEPEAEITVECAPGQLGDATLEALAAAGVNRVSLGVQSFIDREAAVSGRLHSRAVVMEDLRRLRAAGIANLNVDLIAGLAGQTFASWEESLAVLAGTGVPHASVYMLEVDEDSRLGREVLAHGVRYHAELVPTDDVIARMYEAAIERLGKSGLEQYEISNFCRPGMASRHNLRYWQRRPYLGLGLDASSMLREVRADGVGSLKEDPQEPASGAKAHVDSAGLMYGLKPVPFNVSSLSDLSSAGRVLRSTTTDDLKAYLSGTQPAETVWHLPARQYEEAWFLGLRLNTGVDVAALEREFGAAMGSRAMEVVGRLAEDGLVIFDGVKVRLTARGRLLSNDVFQEFLGLDAQEAGRDV